VSPFDPTDRLSLTRRAETYSFAFELAGHALADQERLGAELRGRGGGIVATAAVTMSVFGGPALGRLPTGPALYVAVAAFAGVCICVLDLFWPRRLVVTIDAEKVIATYAEPRHVPLALVHRELALHRAASFSRNRAAIDRMLWSSRGALLLLAVEVVAWVVSYAQTL
jgi:hypothetical protein